MRVRRILVGAVLLVVLALVVVFNVVNVSEAYGDGPPYYARTVNMDKWSDPLPVLGAVDALMLV
ncbi:hypothetical protein, partial [Burkholderia stabilis]